MSHAAHAHDDHQGPHVVPFWLLAAIFAALLALTVITYAVSLVDLGEFNLIVAMAVALIKGSLVVLFFMHLMWDALFNAICLISGLGFTALFIVLSLLDTGEYKARSVDAFLKVASNRPAITALGPTVGPAAAAAPHGAPAPEAKGHAAAAPVAAEGKKEEPKKDEAPKAAPLDPALVEKGKQLFQAKICFTCHQTNPDPALPPLPCPSFAHGIAGKKEKVQIGIGGPIQEVIVDEAYFIESIKSPLAKITVNEQNGQPYPPVMVLPFPVSDEEIKALWAYTQSLGKK